MASGVRLVCGWALRSRAHPARSTWIASRRALGTTVHVQSLRESLEKRDYDAAIATLENLVSAGKAVPPGIWNQLIEECHTTPRWKRVQESSFQGDEAFFNAKLMFLGKHTSPEVLKDVLAEIKKRGLGSEGWAALPSALERNIPFLVSELDDARSRLGSLTKSLEVQNAALDDQNKAAEDSNAQDVGSATTGAEGTKHPPARDAGWSFRLMERSPTLNDTTVLGSDWWECLNRERDGHVARVNLVNAVEKAQTGCVIDSKKALEGFAAFRRTVNDDAEILPQTWAVVCQLSHRLADRKVADLLLHYGRAYGPNAVTQAIGGFVAVGDYEGALTALDIAQGNALDLDAAYEALFGLCASPRHVWLLARIRAHARTRASDGDLGPRFYAGLIRALGRVQKLSDARKVASDAFRTHRGSHGDRILAATMSIEEPATACSIFEELRSHLEVGCESLRAYLFALRHVKPDEVRQEKLSAAMSDALKARRAGTLEFQSGDGRGEPIGNAYLWSQGWSMERLSEQAFNVLKSVGENKTDETRAVIYLACHAAEHPPLLTDLLSCIPDALYDRTMHGVLDSMVANQWTPSVALLEIIMTMIHKEARYLRDRLKVHLAAAHMRESVQTGDWALVLGARLRAASLLDEVEVLPPADVALLLETLPKVFMKERGVHQGHQGAVEGGALMTAPNKRARSVDYLTSRRGDLGSWDYQRLILAVQDSGADVRSLIYTAKRLIEIGVDPPASAVIGMIERLIHFEADDTANREFAAVVASRKSRPLEQAMYVRLLADGARGLRPHVPANTTGAPLGFQRESQSAETEQAKYRELLAAVAHAILGRTAEAAAPVAASALHEAELLQHLLERSRSPRESKGDGAANAKDVWAAARKNVDEGPYQFGLWAAWHRLLYPEVPPTPEDCEIALRWAQRAGEFDEAVDTVHVMLLRKIPISPAAGATIRKIAVTSNSGEILWLVASHSAFAQQAGETNDAPT